MKRNEGIITIIANWPTYVCEALTSGAMDPNSIPKDDTAINDMKVATAMSNIRFGLTIVNILVDGYINSLLPNVLNGAINVAYI